MTGLARPMVRTPVGQFIIAAALVVAFVYGRWLIIGDEYSGGFIQCAPVALLATLMLNRFFALLAIASATASAFLLYFDAGTADFEDLKIYLSALAIVGSVVIVAAVGLALVRQLGQARATIDRLEARNDELRDRLAQSFRTALRLSPDPADFASAEDYHREWSARLAALAGAGEILRHDIERQAILPDLAETALLPYAPDGRISIRLPHATLPRETVAALGMTLLGLVTSSLRAGALADREGRVRVTGSLLGQGKLELNWREIGARAASQDHLAALATGALAAIDAFAAVEARTAPCEYNCTISIAGAGAR